MDIKPIIPTVIYYNRHKPECDEHGPCMYSETRDAHYCVECNVWAEDTCGDPECEYCVGRPEKPLDNESPMK